jgi:hypothetical protein
MINDYLEILIDYTGLTLTNMLSLLSVVFLFLMLIKKAR